MISDKNSLVWNDVFSRRSPSFYPYDNVVSFVFQNKPKDQLSNKIKILEVGCGGGNNLWFAAKEGFDVKGIDISEKAIEIAKNRFEKENLKGSFYVGDFLKLPFKDEEFDLIIDRCSTVCVDKKQVKIVIQEIYRVLKQGGKFFYNTYSDKHSSYSEGTKLKNGSVTNINSGSLAGLGDLCFYNESEIKKQFDKIWKIMFL